MARLNVVLPEEIMKEFKNLNNNAEKMFGEMTQAGAEEVVSNVKASVPKQSMSSHVKITRAYKTPSDGGINTKVYLSGYIPFKGNRKTFSRSGRNGSTYITTKGIPVEFLANVFEYGRHNGNPFPKKPFFRRSFKKSQIEQAMLKVQEKYIKE